MTLPSQSLTVLDPGLGLISPSPNSPIYTGPAVGGTGTVGVLYSFSRLNDIRGTLGFGELAEDVALALSERGGPVLAIITASSTAGANSAVVNTGGGPVVTYAGTARDTYTGIVKIVGGGALGVGTFQYALDNHTVTSGSASPTYSALRTIPAGGTFVCGSSGLTLTFAAGTYIAGANYTFSTTPGLANSTDLSTAATTIFANSTILFPLWMVTGTYLTAATASAMAVALSGHLTTLATNFRYVRGIIDIGSGDTSANVRTERANWSSKRIVASYSYDLVTSQLPYEGFSVRKVSHRAPLSSRCARILISTDAARFAEGPLENVTGIAFDGYLDSTLDDNQISTPRTWPGIAGYYVAKARLASNPPSDFIDLHFGRIMDTACRAVYQAQLPFIAEGFRTVSVPLGAIDPLDKADVETAGNAALTATLLEPKNARGRPGHVSAAKYSVDGTNNVNTSQTLLTAVAIRPLGYANFINTQLGFSLNV